MSISRRDSPASALREYGLAPRKRLGQNFLRDPSFLDRIVRAAEVDEGDEVLEVGPGTGVLTRALLNRAARVVAVELDDSLHELLRQQLGSHPGLELVHGNALGLVPANYFAGPYKLIGNIPYYISGPILRHYLESHPIPQTAVLMVQREVAQRITAPPGSMSLLAVSVQFYAEPSIVARVPAGAFFPVPKVDSAILRLVPRRVPYDVDREAFFHVVRAGFSLKRKQIVNSLASGLQVRREAVRPFLREAGIDEVRRAETLSVEEWVSLTNEYRHGPADAVL